MDSIYIVLIILSIVLALGGILFAILLYQHLNFYPSKVIVVNITNKRVPNENEAIDYYIFNYGTKEIEEHIEEINRWRRNLLDKNKDNTKKFNRILDRMLKNENKAFKFCFYRVQTRYRQVNYQRFPYKTRMVSYRIWICDRDLNERIEFLKSHDLYVTYDQFHSKDQRRALTPKLKEMIKQRDNYTCQICGKYMPDEVGLHIDHIIPISKGGKSTPDNLRVLCSKCNGRKGNN